MEEVLRSHFPKYFQFQSQPHQRLTVKAAVTLGVLQHAAVGVYGGPEDKDAGVEAVGPAWVGGRWQLFSLKQLIHVA